MGLNTEETAETDQIPVVTSIYTTEVRLRCPHCNSIEEGFVVNPAGHEFECDSCGRKYKIHPEADIEYGY